MSLIFLAAIDQWRQVRGDYQLMLEAHYREAGDACNGVLLNRRGRERGIDPFTLFKGPGVRARAYASEELLEHWRTTRPRVTFEEFERGYYADVRDQLEALSDVWDETPAAAAHGR